MNSFPISGLHIYVNTVGPDTLDQYGVFYSQRLNGPYYRWTYEERLGRWSGHRLPSNLLPDALQNGYQRVPQTLWVQLREHYVY